LNRFKEYKPYGVAVSDLVSQLWCEKQLDLKLTTDIEPEVTEEIRKGKEKHKELEEELVEVIKIKPRTFEDSIFLKLFQDLQHLIGLQQEGIVREVPVFGNLNGLFVRGVVDEIRRNDGVLKVRETKTRRSPTVPSKPQLRCNKFQVMLYQKLLKDMRSGKLGYDNVSEFYQLDPENITKDFLDELEVKVSGNVPIYGLDELGEVVFDRFTELPPVSEKMTLRYIYQKTDEEIDTKRFDFDVLEFKDTINFVSGYWNGKREPRPVGKRHEWKCNYCDYTSECPKATDID